MKSIDLFAGCGGLSLGLEQAGFQTIFVNELHPDAMKTFLDNRPKSDLVNERNHVLDVRKITRNKTTLYDFSSYIKSTNGEIDLVCGGPPCQGFSGIGHRRSFKVSKKEMPTNHLYKDMAKVISAIGPKFFLFENVRGLLTSRWTADGEKGEIWRDVQKTFSNIETILGKHTYGYTIGYKLVFAKNFGVPQNRPRIILIGVRDDLGLKLNGTDSSMGLIPDLSITPPNLVDLLSDLSNKNWNMKRIDTHYFKDPMTEIQKYLRTFPGGKIMAKGFELTDQEYSNHSPDIIAKFEYMIANKSMIPESMKTKKFSQKVLPRKWTNKGPTITATSLPDDYVHYELPRILTVREWARLQTFPDWYKFAGKRTTGGRRRAGNPDEGDWTRELPKYTQIGNAVPVLLAKEIGLHLKKLI